ncbi:ATP synthase subunit b', chloroplastic [Apostasia shenzhenica]|uniref:ATP synthase subunit b', chloroplastic n=1 Tax=Apostasia shenzhenica TaxID=1088818 RepID=A0A2H9ZZZ7_9ASPA|nr:ATP synthase subunit b', chloroplastic [Apostasia shenzhenica]
MASAVVTSSSSSSAAAAAAAAAAAQFLRRPSNFSPAPAFRAAPRAQSGGEQKLQLHHQALLKSAAMKAAAAAASLAAAAAALPLPAVAEAMEKAALFDFNLTLPAIALEFLLLMVALDKIYFTPLGKFMDERDVAIRAQLSDVKDTSEEVKQLEEQAAAVMKAARAEISAALNQMKKETTAELEKKLAEGKKKVEAELAEALASLERQKEDTIKALDSQIQLLSDEIVSKVLPPA